MKSPFSIFGSILMACLLLSACEREAPQPTDPLDLLPPATQTGENTLGFLLDGEPWTPNRLFQGQYRRSDGAFSLPCRRDSFDTQGEHAGETFQILSIDSLWEPGNYDVASQSTVRARFFSFSSLCEYHTFHTGGTGKITFTRLDTIERIASGAFDFILISPDCQDTIEVTHGRFDVSF